MIPKQTPVCNFRPAAPCRPPLRTASSTRFAAEKVLLHGKNALYRNAFCPQAPLPRRLPFHTASPARSAAGKVLFHGKIRAKKREARFWASLRSVSGGIRTRDLQSRSLTRYPAALQTQSTLLLYLVLRRRARPSFIPACSACAPPVSRSAPRRRAALPPPSPGSRGRCGGAAPLPCGRGVALPPRS